MYEEYLGEGIQSVESLRKLNEDLLFEMATIQPRVSGLPYELWLDPSGKDRNNEHTNTPRLKVEVDGKFIPMLIDDNPDIPNSVRKQGVSDFPHMSAVKKYILAYKDVLLAHFYRKINDTEALSLLHTIKNAANANAELKVMLSPKNDGTIEYYWDAEESLYVIEVKDAKGEVVTTRYAFDEHKRYKEIEDLKDAYEIEKVVKKEQKNN